MASPRQVLNIVIAGTSIVGAWRTFKRSKSTFGQFRALLGIASAAAVVYGILRNSSRKELA